MINPKETLIFPITKLINEPMASGAIVPNAKHKRSEISNKRLKPTTVVRPIPLVMMKISLNSTSKLEVRNLKWKLTAELEKVRTLINRLEPVPDKTANNGNKGGSDKGKAQILKSLLTKLMKHKFGWIFNTPVDAVKSGLHDYHKEEK